MESGRKLPLSHTPKKSGSGKRQKQRIIGVRVTQDTYDRLNAAAESEHITVPSYVRDFLLKAPGVRTRRRARADVAALAKLIAELNRIGGNINQLARSANYGNAPESAWLREALTRLLKVMRGVRAAMGFEA